MYGIPLVSYALFMMLLLAMLGWQQATDHKVAWSIAFGILGMPAIAIAGLIVTFVGAKIRRAVTYLLRLRLILNARKLVNHHELSHDGKPFEFQLSIREGQWADAVYRLRKLAVKTAGTPMGREFAALAALCSKRGNAKQGEEQFLKDVQERARLGKWREKHEREWAIESPLKRSKLGDPT